MGFHGTRTKDLLAQILANQEKQMSGLTNLQTAVAALTTEVTQILADIQTALANADSDAAVQAASDIVTTATANLVAGDPLTPGVTPPPASTPVTNSTFLQ